MKHLKRFVVAVVLYFMWKQLSLPLLIVFTAFFGKYLVKGQDAAVFQNAQDELMSRFDVWIHGIDPNVVIYCIFFGLTMIVLYGMYRLHRSFSLTRPFAKELTPQSGGSTIDRTEAIT